MHPADANRRRLDTGWQLLSTACGQFDNPRALPEAGWSELPLLTTAAGWACDDSSGRLNKLPPGASLDSLDWWYRLSFDHDATDATHVALEFDGLATIARVWLNGDLLLDSDNMFLAHRSDVCDRLRSPNNVLVMCFRAMAPELAKRRPRPAWRVPMLEQQQLRWFRTSLLGRTPGWSPPVPPVGPWRDIWLVQPSVAPGVERRDLWVRVDGDMGHCELACALIGDEAPVRAVFVLRRGDEVLSSDMVLGADGLLRTRLTVPNVALWWPHTHGEPALYRVQVEVHYSEGATCRELGSIGFRRVRVETRDGGFAVCVNDTPVFCRGACWMPPDPVGWRPDAADIRATVRRARDAGMNMLRVSGTTAYEGEEFFDACDEFGMLVWQDLMFANMDYPSHDAAFVASVRSEVTAQLQAWQGRPSLAVVCGNSEVSQQAAMWGAPQAAWSPALFNEWLPAWVAELLPELPYWPSSASGGAFPHQPGSGTTSYYGVGAYLRPLTDARRSGVRFATECLAFSNVPSPQTIARMPGGAGLRATHPAWKERAPRDLTAGWDFEDVRDHYMAQLFAVDPTRLRYEDHERYLALARATTGEVMVSAFSEWRRAGSECGGALVWFLRDLWAGAGWGVLDDLGAPKACFHALRRVLQAQAVLLTDEGNGGLVAHLVNERPARFVGRLSFDAWRGETSVFHGERAIELAPHSVQPLALASLLDHFSDLNHAYRFGPLVHDVVVVSLFDAKGQCAGQAHHFPGGLGLARESDLGIEATSRHIEDGGIEVSLCARRFALGIHFEAPGYAPDDEFFHLPPGQQHKVVFRPDAPARPWWGRVLALNAVSSVAIRGAE